MLQKMGESSQLMNDGSESQTINRALMSAVFRILKTLIRLLLRHGVPFQAFSDMAKRAYVEVARDDFGIPGRKPTTSRIAVLTGLTRKEIQKLLESALQPDSETAERYNRAARVVSGWIRDRDFSGVDAQPSSLDLDGANGTFADLVRRYSGDMPPRAVLDELLRVGAVEKLGDGRVKLVARAYIPRSSDSDMLAILGSDVADLIGSIDHNLQHTDDPRFQRKVMYDNLSREGVAKFRDLSAARAQGLIEYLDSWLSQHDRDVNPTVDGTGRMRAGLGIFYFEENLETSGEEK
jgi:hypothetical protein